MLRRTLANAEPVTHQAVRNARGLARFELFLGSSVATVLIVRGALAATGYPKVGSGGLHVAHVLYGGLLLAVAVVLLEIVPGSRMQTRAALVGGIGFGLFIDEVGKFLTKDVNYFFKPAVAIMYVVFMGFYFGVRDLLLRKPLDDHRRLALASTMAADLALGQLDRAGRRAALQLLAGLPDAPLPRMLSETFRAEETKARRFEDRVTHWRDAVTGATARFMETPAFHRWVLGAGLVQTLGISAELLLMVTQPDVGRGNGSHTTDITAGIATAVSAAYALTGAFRSYRGNTDGAIRVLYRSGLVTLLVTQILVFARYQWSGLLGLGAESLLLLALRFVAHAHDPVQAVPDEPADTEG